MRLMLTAYEHGYADGVKAMQAQHEQELRDAVEGARKGERERVLDDFTRKIQQTYVGKYDNEAGDIPDVPVDELSDIIRSLRSTGSNPGEQEQRAELPPSMPEGGTDPMK